MPRYFFDTITITRASTRQTWELPDNAAVREQMRRTLPELVKAVSSGQNTGQFRVDVCDESGNCVATSIILMVLQCVEDRERDVEDRERDTQVGRQQKERT